MTDQIADTLRRKILSQEFVAGQRVTQAELSAQLGVSAMPVREALLRLVNEGLITTYANRGFAVADASKASIRDVYWLHSLVAGELSARACDHLSAELLGELKRLHSSYQEAERRGEREASFAINWDFHAALNAAAASSTLVHALKSTMAYFPGFFYEIEGWSALADQWQAGLIDRLAAHDREGARAVAADCVMKAADLFVERFWADDHAAAPISSQPRHGERQ